MALTDEAIGKIKEMIISGRVRPGEKLPREADLAAELGLSRNSLREAVKALTLVNVLDVRQGDGTYATSLAPSLLLEALSFIVDFHRDDTVLEFFEVRRILEPAATGAAAVRMSAEEKAPRTPPSRTSSRPTWNSTRRSPWAPATRCWRRWSTTCRCQPRGPASGGA
jgi:GntR family transcriptional regulator, transcriptional repressor for pyruvate dehydrogenase complex